MLTRSGHDAEHLQAILLRCRCRRRFTARTSTAKAGPHPEYGEQPTTRCRRRPLSITSICAHTGPPFGLNYAYRRESLTLGFPPIGIRPRLACVPVNAEQSRVFFGDCRRGAYNQPYSCHSHTSTLNVMESSSNLNRDFIMLDTIIKNGRIVSIHCKPMTVLAARQLINI